MKSPLLKYTIKYSIFALAGCVGLFGFSAAFLYFITFIFFYPIAISVWIKIWKDKQTVIVETSDNRWIFYVNGVPIHESISSLYNLHTDDEKSLESVFKKLFSFKLLILFLFSVFSINELINIIQRYLVNPQDYLLLAVVLCGSAYTLFIVYRLVQCLSMFQFISKRRWHIIREPHNNQYYYSAYRWDNGSQAQVYTPLLEFVFTY